MMNDSDKAAISSCLAILGCWLIWAILFPGVLTLRESVFVLQKVPDIAIGIGPPIVATVTIAVWYLTAGSIDSN